LPQNYITYTHGDKAEDPKGAKTGSFKYELVPMSVIWDRRDDVGKGKFYESNYNYVGSRFTIPEVPYSFAGEKHGHGKAKTPWAWNNFGDKDVKRGDWFFDPAYVAYIKLNKPKNFSMSYVYNTYFR
jgi:hypothetical protein